MNIKKQGIMRPFINKTPSKATASPETEAFTGYRVHPSWTVCSSTSCSCNPHLDTELLSIHTNGLWRSLRVLPMIYTQSCKSLGLVLPRN